MDKKNITIKEWLNTPCAKEEIKGDETTGFFLGIDTVKTKIKFMEDTYGVRVSCHNLIHIFFITPDRNCFVSGSLNMQISFEVGGFKELVGAATFNLQEYAPNQHYAATLKSLCICNALLEYPQFGGLLNKELLPTQAKPEDKKPTSTPREERAKVLIDSCVTKAELNSYLLSIPPTMKEYFNQKMKQLKK